MICQECGAEMFPCVCCIIPVYVCNDCENWRARIWVANYDDEPTDALSFEQKRRDEREYGE